MADFDTLGKALQIPDNVIKNIDAIDKKINQIATDSEKMATVFQSAMTRMGNGADGLLKKLQTMQATINKLDMSKFSQGVQNLGRGVTQVEQFAASIAKAAEAISKYNRENERRGNVDNSKQIRELNKEIETLKKRTKQLDEYIEKLKQANQGGGRTRGGGSSGINSDVKAMNAYNRAMASSEALVTQRINKIAKLRQAEEMLRNASGNYATQLNRINQEIARLNKLNQGQVDSYGRVIRSQRNLVNTSQQLTRQLALIFSVSQIEGYISKLIRVRGEFELQQTALASILQNKDQADQLFAQITELAVKSPFTVKELTTYTKSLSAYQVEYEKLYDTTKMLADVSAGLGVDMQRLILAFGQVKAANFLRGTEVRQFTEAGLNILGELAKYYSELEGRMISVGEVQDMVTKRMVSFGDVEEVFKRITSAGGIFYNMQERQAETLAGQMSNLQDQIDLMFNEIGKQNQGSLNTAISIIKAVIENWEILANILQSAAIGWTVYAAKTLLAAAANKAFSSSAIVATRDMKGLTGMTAKVITSMRSFFSVLKANPIAIIATVVTSAVIAWNKHKKAVEENIKSYDPMVNSVSRAKEELSDLAEKITEQNEKLNEAVNNVSKYKKGTDEYVTAEISANKEREKQNQLLNELKTKYPEIYTGISKQINGNEELTKVLQEQLVAYGYVLEQQQYLSYLGRQTATGEDNGILKNIQQATEATNATKTASEDVDFAYKQMLGRINEFFATNKRVSDSFKDTINGIINSTESADDKISKLLTSIYGFEGSGVFNIGDLRRSIDRTGLEDIVSTYRDAEDLRKKELEELEKDIAYITKEYLRSYDTTTSEGLKNAEEAATKYVKSLNIHNQEVLDFAKQQFEVKLGISIDLKEIPAELGIVEKRINDYLDKNQFNLIERIKPGEGMEKFFKELQDNLKTYKSELEKYQSATGQLSPEFTNEEMIDQYNAKIKQVSETLNYWGYAIKEKNNDSKTELDILKEQLKIIKQVVDAYNKYKQYMSEGEASSLAEQLADGTVAEKVVGTLSLDTSGLIEGLEKFSEEAAKKAGEEGQKAVDEVIRDYKEKNIIEIEVKGIEAAKERVSSIFQSYEFSLDLNTKGIDASEFRNMLKSVGATDAEISFMGLNTTTFEEAQKQLRDEIIKLQEEGGDEQLDAAKKYQEKLTDLEIKEARKRFDELLTLREKYQTNEQKIDKVQTDIETWQRELYDIKKLGDAANAEQKELLEMRIQNGNDTILKLKSEALQLTDFWRTLFGDLEDLSVNSLRSMSNMVDEIISNRKGITGNKGQLVGYSSSYTDNNGIVKQVTLTVEQYQRLLKQNNNVADEIEEKNPFIALFDAITKGKNEGESTLDYITRMEGILTSVTNAAFDVANNLADIFGANEDAKDFINNLQGIVNGAKDLGVGISKIASGDIIGGGVQAISGIASTINSIFKIGDKKKEREIQRQIDLVEDLQRSYEKLEEAINDAYSIDTYKKASDQAIANLEEQNKRYEEMIASEQDKKDTDEDRIKEWQNQIEDNNDTIEQIIEEQFSTVTGGILDNILSTSSEFTDAWLEAFKETGEGLSGLEESFQEMLENIIKQQATMLITNQFVEKWKKQLEKYINTDDLELTTNEANKWVDSVTSSLPALNQALENYFKAMENAGINVSGSKDYELSTLSKGISGITETQADALASITESIRFFTSDSNSILRNMYNFLLTPPAESPFMQQLLLQSQRLGMIYDLWNSVIKSVPSSGRAVKVQIV